MAKKRKRKPLPETKKTFLNDKRIKRTAIQPIDTVEYQEKVESIYECIKKGMRRAEIFATLCVTDHELTERGFLELMMYAEKYAENAIHRDRDYVFQLHMGRYEKIYEKALEKADDGHRLFTTIKGNKEKWAHWQSTVTNYQQALSALNHKEDLLGLHDKRVVLEFNDQKAIVVEKEENRGGDGVAGYCLDNLTLQEQIELLGLIKDARTIPIEGIQRVVVKTTTIEIDPETGQRKVGQLIQNIDQIQAVEFEEMPENVQKRMKIVPEEELEMPEEIPNPIKDSLPNNLPKNPKTANEIGKMIQNDVMKKFKDKLKSNKK